MGVLQLKRVYDAAEPSDGYRILIDRLWPRGLTKEKAAVNYWAKQAAPGAALRLRYHQGLIDYAAFAAAYERELSLSLDAAGLAALIKAKQKEGNVTLVYAGREPEKSHVPVLIRYIQTNMEDTVSG